MSQIGFIFPRDRGDNKKYLSCHQPAAFFLKNQTALLGIDTLGKFAKEAHAWETRFDLVKFHDKNDVLLMGFHSAESWEETSPPDSHPLGIHGILCSFFL